MPREHHAPLARSKAHTAQANGTPTIPDNRNSHTMITDTDVFHALLHALEGELMPTDGIATATLDVLPRWFPHDWVLPKLGDLMERGVITLDGDDYDLHFKHPDMVAATLQMPPWVHGLVAGNYYMMVRNVDGDWRAVARMYATWGVLYGIDETGMRGRFCFGHVYDAVEALHAWTTTEASGTLCPGDWIKHKGEWDGVGVDNRNPAAALAEPF